MKEGFLLKILFKNLNFNKLLTGRYAKLTV